MDGAQIKNETFLTEALYRFRLLTRGENYLLLQETKIV